MTSLGVKFKKRQREKLIDLVEEFSNWRDRIGQPMLDPNPDQAMGLTEDQRTKLMEFRERFDKLEPRMKGDNIQLLITDPNIIERMESGEIKGVYVETDDGPSGWIPLPEK
jgi:hypothetical protein